MTGRLFSNKQLKNMIMPLFFEQLLVLLVGLADTFIVSSCGEAAVSGVSLVNAFNTIFIYLFAAIASGGAVVVSQYFGRNDREHASESIGQLLMISVLFSASAMAVILAGNRTILRLLFGKVEPAVMDACVTYLRISAFSYPAMAIYNTGAAMFRSIARTDTTMYISVISNVINIVGNVIGVFVLKAGVAGVAWPTLIAHTFSAVVITILCFSKKHEITYRWKHIFKWNSGLIKTILHIAVPNGIESGLFQFVKVALSSVVALFGTYQIAANGIAQSIWSLSAIIRMAMTPVFITVIGQCMGAGDIPQAEYYFAKLTKITVVCSIIWNILIFALTPPVMMLYSIEEETKHLVIILVLIHNLFNTTVLPYGEALCKGLVATGDVIFTTATTIICTVAVRLVFSVIFAVTLNMGVIGIAWAMDLDWCVRAVIFHIRYRGGKWKTLKVLKD